MKKIEFVEKMKSGEIHIGHLRIELNEVTDAPDVTGCCKDNDNWIIFRVRERQGHEVFKEYSNEGDAFDFFYELILFGQRMS